eukprot:Gb_16358 [translate_table: standard]
MPFSQISNAGIENFVFLKIFPFEPWMSTQGTVFWQTLHYCFSGEESTAKRTVWYYPNTQLPAYWDYVFLNVTSPKRPFELNSSYRMHRMGSSNSVDTGFRESNIFDFSLLHKLFKFSNCFFYRNCCIHPMLIVKINVINVKTFKAGFTTLPHILWRTLGIHLSICKYNPKLCCELNFLSREIL